MNFPVTFTETGSETPTTFSGVVTIGSEAAVLYTPQTLTPEQQAQARENIGAADKTELQDTFGNYKTNKIILDECIGVGYINTDGTIKKDSEHWETSYIKVKPNDVVRVITNGQSYTASSSIVAIYDENRNFVTTVKTSIPYVCPDDFAYSYVRLPIWKPKISSAITNTIITINDETIYSEYIKPCKDLYNEINDVYVAIDKVADSYAIKSISIKNLFNKDTATIGSYINGLGEWVTDPNIYESDYINCKGVTTICINPEYSQGIVFFDAEKNFIGAVYTDKGIVPVKENAVYFRCYGLVSNLETDMVAVGAYPNVYIPYGTEILEIDDVALQYVRASNLYNWKGKKCIQLGDSITWYDGQDQNGIAIKGYASYMRELGMSVDNKGVSGACITNLSTYKDIVETVDETTNFADYDLCMIAGGVNDYAFWDSPIGDFANAEFDKGVFTQAYQYIIEQILAQNPTIKIFLCTPLKTTHKTGANEQGYTLEDYANRIKEIGKYYSIPVLDLYGVGGINKVNVSNLTKDGLHPNNEGYKLVCEHSLIPFVRNI